MNFLALVIALLLRQLPDSGAVVQRDDWFRRWQARVGTWNIGAAGRLFAAVLPAMVVAGLILGELHTMLFGLLWIAAAVLLLLYGLGRGDFHQSIEHYRSQCRAGDFEGAYLGTLPTLDAAATAGDPHSPEQVHDLLQQGFFYEGFQRWFPVLFYFVLFGPVGALGYRLLQLCRDNFEAALTARFLFLLDWVPARLLAATFALAGNFVSSRDALLRNLGDPGASASRLLFEVGSAAMDTPAPVAGDIPEFNEFAARQNEDAGRLLSRSAICWLAVIAVIVLLD